LRLKRSVELVQVESALPRDLNRDGRGRHGDYSPPPVQILATRIAQEWILSLERRMRKTKRCGGAVIEKLIVRGKQGPQSGPLGFLALCGAVSDPGGA
jgi:hypothetical protein